MSSLQRPPKQAAPSHVDWSGVKVDLSVILGTVGRPQLLRECIEALMFVWQDRTYTVSASIGANDGEPAGSGAGLRSGITSALIACAPSEGACLSASAIAAIAFRKTTC